MKKYILYFGAALMIVLASCSKDKVQTNIQPTKDAVSLDMNSNPNDLADRIELVNTPVVFKGENLAGLNYTWVANLTPITINGITLSCSTVDGYGDKAYVGWHAAGEDVLGEISVISVADPNSPLLIQDKFFPSQEFNDIEVKANVGRIYFAGGAAQSYVTGQPAGDYAALAWSANLQSDGKVGDLNWDRLFNAYSANSITYVNNQSVWISTGAHGGLKVIKDNDPDNVKIDEAINNVKHFDATGEYGVLLYGVGYNESVVRVYDMTSDIYNYVAEYTIPYDVTALGKNAVDINHEFAYLAMGNDGIVKVNLTNGNVENVFDLENGGFANGVTVDFQHVYAAYGKDGLYVLDKNSFTVLGHWDYDGSCNYVKKVGDFIYIANGNVDGMIILRKD